MDRGWGSFNQDPEGKYRRFISEIPPSSSDLGLNVTYNWFSKIESAVDISVIGNGTDALTEHGLDIYHNDYRNFGLKCGDNYITTYKEGSLLLMSIVIEFRTKHDKNVFLSLTD